MRSSAQLIYCNAMGGHTGVSLPSATRFGQGSRAAVPHTHTYIPISRGNEPSLHRIKCRGGWRLVIDEAYVHPFKRYYIIILYLGLKALTHADRDQNITVMRLYIYACIYCVYVEKYLSIRAMLQL